MRELRDRQLIVVVTPTEKEAIRKAFGSYAAMRDYVVDVAQMMLEGKKDDDEKDKKRELRSWAGKLSGVQSGTGYRSPFAFAQISQP